MLSRLKDARSAPGAIFPLLKSASIRRNRRAVLSSISRLAHIEFPRRHGGIRDSFLIRLDCKYDEYLQLKIEFCNLVFVFTRRLDPITNAKTQP
jgi:hypothetical protein